MKIETTHPYQESNIIIPLNIKNEYCALAWGTTAPHRDLSANETYMALPLILAADLWDTTILAIQQLFGFNLLRALASLKRIQRQAPTCYAMFERLQ